ncbi:Tubulin polyglutamylase TTLL5 [Papilio xuthus]|uniref:Tubulin--tyrosine ligase-like protein 5 n=1 Tax=Papilio xuthus TaxID=66420 RepID=A0A194PLU5_PAPXU|nr:Tubulin polyglutamylase TTLL5 [Papilio xuthus]
MQGRKTSASNFKVPSDDFPKVHTKCNHVRPHTRVLHCGGSHAVVMREPPLNTRQSLTSLDNLKSSNEYRLELLNPKYAWGIVATVRDSHSNPLHGNGSLAAAPAFTSVVSGPPTATDSGRRCHRKAREIAVSVSGRGERGERERCQAFSHCYGDEGRCGGGTRRNICMSTGVLESSNMPARILQATYKLVNTETKLLHRLLQAHGLQEAPPDSKDFNLMWAGLHPKPDVLRALSPYQRVNHFPRSYELTRKDKLFKNIEKMQYFRGVKNFDFIPTTFLMPTEYKELCTAHYRTKGPWIVKPAASSRGRGIYIVNTPDQIPKGDNVVVAKYIDRPLLIGGHKCDLRLYVCVTSVDPLLVYLYEEGLVRFATVKYDKTNKNLWNPCMHLCNYSINKYHTDYIKCEDPVAGDVGHKWTLSALLRTLRAQGRDTRALMAAVEDLVVKSVLCSAHTMAAAARVFVPNVFNCFGRSSSPTPSPPPSTSPAAGSNCCFFLELFGYDILVDENLKPWLLEINLSPSAGACTPRRTCACGAAGRARRRGAGGAGLAGEELRIVRAVRAQYVRRGGFVRIFPSQNSWQKYAQYLGKNFKRSRMVRCVRSVTECGVASPADPVTGIPVCSTSVNSNAPYAALQHNYNLLVHAHVLPHFRQAAAHTDPDLDTDTPQRLRRYETVAIAGAAPAVHLAESAPPPRDARRAKDLIKQQLLDGLKLTGSEGRRAFGLYLTHVLKRVSCAGGEQAAQHAALLLRFLRRAAATLRMPYNVKGPPAKMCDKDRCAVVAKQLSDFLYLYCRDADLCADADRRDGCVSNIHFAQFLCGASEADLEEVLLLVLRLENHVAPFLGDARNPYCVDLPPERLAARAQRHSLLRLLAALAPITTRRYYRCAPPTPRTHPTHTPHTPHTHTPHTHPTHTPHTHTQPLLRRHTTRTHPTRNPHASRAHPAHAPHTSRVHSAHAPHAIRTRPAHVPRAPRTRPARTPHTPRIRPARTPHTPRTHPAHSPHTSRAHPAHAPNMSMCVWGVCPTHTKINSSRLIAGRYQKESDAWRKKRSARPAPPPRSAPPRRPAAPRPPAAPPLRAHRHPPRTRNMNLATSSTN